MANLTLFAAVSAYVIFMKLSGQVHIAIEWFSPPPQGVDIQVAP